MRSRFAGATENPSADSLYHQKEQAFLDANDLSKGRYFDEATLPPLPNYAEFLSRKYQEAVQSRPEPSKASNAIPISPPAGVEASISQTASDAGKQTSPSRPLPEQKPPGTVLQQQRQQEAQVPTQPAPGVTPEGLDASTPKIISAVPGTPKSNQGHDSTEVSVSPSQAKPTPTAGVPSGPAEVSSGQKKPDERPSLVLSRVAHRNEQPLSPVSSAGPYSNNTPVPVAGTRPTDKIVPSPKPEEPTQAPPILVPSTPDEQLRLEEAQSLRQSSLAAKKTIGDSGTDEPSTNEVLQESVAAPTDIPLVPVSKKPDGVVESTEDNEVPTSHQAEQVQPSNAVEPKKGTQTVSGPVQPERMTTRVSSGAIRHKSVSEILGEAPKPAVKPAETTRADRKARERERSKLSTVVFPKQQQQQQLQDQADSMDLLNEERDYLFTLFQSKAYSPPRGTSLSTLLASAHKTLTTANHHLEYQEQMDCRTLRRIYQLQNANRWPLRQMKRSLEPPRQGTHWDVLLDHMKKWKIAAAKKHRSLLQKKETGDEMLGMSHPTPDLVPSTEEDSVSEGYNDEPPIFSLTQKLLDELPVYSPVGIAPETNLPTFKEPPDAVWKTEILPVSKYASGKIAFLDDEPPRKRSHQGLLDLPPEQTNVALFRPENKHIRDRIHPGHTFRPPTEYPMPSWTYAEDDELRRLVKEYSYNWSLISSSERRTPWECFERWIGLEGLPADMSKTQYFRAYHQRLETAQRTQQQQQQQQQQQGNNNPQSLPPVRRRTTQPVRVDRRRSSKHLALLDAMRKLAKKRETMLQKQQHASQLASLRKVNEANQPKPPISTPAEFSRLKYERELKLQERQEQYRQQMIATQRANLAAQRAGQMPNQQPMMNAPGRTPNAMPQNPGTPSMPANTPNGMPNGLPNGMPNGIPPGVGANQGRPHMQAMPGSGPVNGPMPPNPMAMKMMPQSGMQQTTTTRPGMPMQTTPDNTRVIREANRLQEQQRLLQSRQQQQNPQPQPQQPQQQFHNQQQFVGQGSHSPNMNVPNVNGTPNNPAMMAALQAGGGMQSPSFHNATPQGVSTPSPRMGQPNLLSSGVVPTISSLQNQIQRTHPGMPTEQVNKLATERLHQYQQQRMSQVAMNAAAGNIGAVQANYQMSQDGNFQSPQNGMNGGPGIQMPQTQGYSPMMRVPQTAQQNRVGVGNSPAMNGAVPQPSRSATPQTQRSGSAQGGPIPPSNKSPNPPQAQTASS
ncbi:hypothetical protein BDV36DRAFT_304827 [Aspergillus pseudocaelatus]|uniref:Myb-like domain-containing protein n=1 Tax=Aspergillus pseudocaelatus TaxID=1825620 RepID=A0ABQ6W5S8_9EURO|nr:hypothetical protein BDV36DRAFT_304827 [Aspergillus pseudocaelatus]